MSKEIFSKTRIYILAIALLILALTGGWLFFFNAPDLQADKEVKFTVNGSVDSPRLKPGNIANFTFTVTSNTSNDISADILITINDSKGKTVYDQNWLKQSFSKGKSITYNVAYKSSFVSEEGNYTAGIKLQNSTKTEFYYNNPKIATFTMESPAPVSRAATPVPGQSVNPSPKQTPSQPTSQPKGQPGSQTPPPTVQVVPGTTVPTEPEPSLVKSGLAVLLRMNMDQDRNQLKLAQATGADMIRITISWRRLEQLGKGQYNTEYINYMNQILDYARSLKLQVLVVFGQIPCWASADPDKKCDKTNDELSKYKIWYPPTMANDFGTGFGYAVEKFGNRIAAWEIWNEPNLDIFWGYIKPDPARYTAMLKAVYTAGKKVNPSTVILGASLAGSDFAFIKGMYAAGAKGFYDAIAMHPYASNFTADAPNVCGDSQWSFKCGIEDIHNTMLEAGDTTPLWLTEIGWSSYKGKGGVSEATQAAYLTTAYKMTRDWDYVPVMVWYKLVDHKDDNESISDNSKETNFGLYHEDLTPKPALKAFENLFR